MIVPGVLAPIDDTLQFLERTLLGMALRPGNEFALQNSVEGVLRSCEIDYVREKRLGPQNRPDFFLPQSRLILEVKLRYPRGPTLRQIARYLALEEVAGVVLIGMRPVCFPLDGHAKPVLELPLWKAMFV